ncbi:hypothetical protein PsYK624_074000 [Phanerochaete sordida]|uniref:Uncharacterized protein n=1 Tax=Phanerochaete sordida TaxID=48140 RepID=A0A9P3GAE4_9APHY|nr:hypothetical protein PsYK624_074000 [Phanerochaete sordida]
MPLQRTDVRRDLPQTRSGSRAHVAGRRHGTALRVTVRPTRTCFATAHCAGDSSRPWSDCRENITSLPGARTASSRQSATVPGRDAREPAGYRPCADLVAQELRTVESAVRCQPSAARKGTAPPARARAFNIAVFEFFARRSGAHDQRLTLSRRHDEVNRRAFACAYSGADQRLHA